MASNTHNCEAQKDLLQAPENDLPFDLYRPSSVEIRQENGRQYLVVHDEFALEIKFCPACGQQLA